MRGERACFALAFVPGRVRLGCFTAGVAWFWARCFGASPARRRSARRSPSPKRSRTKIRASGGRRLISGYWGRYVVVLHDEPSRTTRIVRDPTGGFPCFATEMAGVHVYFSRMEDVSDLDDRAFSVNWKYVAAMLCLTQIQIQSTGLNEVSRVLGGECVEHRGGRVSREFYWNPLDLTRFGRCHRRRHGGRRRIARCNSRLCSRMGLVLPQSRAPAVGRSGFVDHPREPEAGAFTPEDGMPQLLFGRVQHGRSGTTHSWLQKAAAAR